MLRKIGPVIQCLDEEDQISNVHWKKGPASRCIERIQMFAVERQAKNSSVFRNKPRIPMLEIIISEYPSLKG